MTTSKKLADPSGAMLPISETSRCCRRLASRPSRRPCRAAPGRCPARSPAARACAGTAPAPPRRRGRWRAPGRPRRQGRAPRGSASGRSGAVSAASRSRQAPIRWFRRTWISPSAIARLTSRCARWRLTPKLGGDLVLRHARRHSTASPPGRHRHAGSVRRSCRFMPASAGRGQCGRNSAKSSNCRCGRASSGLQSGGHLAQDGCRR